MFVITWKKDFCLNHIQSHSHETKIGNRNDVNGEPENVSNINSKLKQN